MYLKPMSTGVLGVGLQTHTATLPHLVIFAAGESSI